MPELTIVDEAVLYPAALQECLGLFYPATMTPSAPGFFERDTSLGRKLDHWDGKVWRRIPYPNPIVYVWGVICANQALPWRPLPRKRGC